MSGYGSTPWGGGPWGSGGAAAPPPPASVFDLFCFEHCDSMKDILLDARVSVVDAGSQFFSNLTTCDLEIRSGDVFPDDDARLDVSESIPDEWTMEFNVRLDEIPPDFSDLVNKHIFFGTTDADGPCAGLFFSKAGIAYAGGIHHDGAGNMVLDSSFTLIPGTFPLIIPGEYITVRIAASSIIGAVYIFVTKTDEIPLTGQVLRAVVPLIDATDLAFPPIDRTHISVRGLSGTPSLLSLDQLCLASSVVIPNVIPVANAGGDQAARTCAIVKLDGTGSFDPEGAPLLFQWRLIDAPTGSSFAFEGLDGFTEPLPTPTGFTNKFYSPALGLEHATDPIVANDVLLLDGTPFTVISTGTDGSGFFVLITFRVIADNLVGAAFKILRNRILATPTAKCATFLGDIPGFYKFDLVVNDGDLDSTPDVTIVNVLESSVPRGCTVSLTSSPSFIFQAIGDFWGLVEDVDRIEVLWDAMAQVTASELLTLWQVEYSKSLRDIQRTFQRRWLHYDLLLAEPIPELTKTRAIRGGVTSVSFPLAGLAGVAGTKIEITSPVLEKPVLFEFAGPDPLTAAAVAGQLTSALAFNTGFSVSVITNRSPPAVSDEEFVRIDATFPFTVSSGTTTTIFTQDDSNTHPSGTSGFSLGVRTYKVERSLEGIGIEEGDLIVINGEGFLISRIADDPNDELPFQRVVVQRDLPGLPGSDWSISGHVTSTLIDFFNGLVFPTDKVTFEVVDLTTNAVGLFTTSALGASELAPGKLAISFDAIDEFVSQPTLFRVQMARVLRRCFLPISDLALDIPTLQEKVAPDSDEDVLRRNVDYFIEETRGQNSIRFVTSVGGPDVWEGGDPPDRMWAETTFLDNRPLIEANFGIPVEFTLDNLEEAQSDLDYLSAVRGLWYSFLNGPTMNNLRIGMQILLGLPFAEEDGIIEEIRDDFSPNQGRILVKDKANEQIVRAYTYPVVLEVEVNPATGVKYVAGDEVTQFAPLVEGSEIIDYIKDPRWFEGILNQGVFFEVEKFHKFMARVDSAAFNLSALLFVRDFILKIKPTYTFPLFVVRLEIADSDVSVTDDIVYKGTLSLFDSVCSGFGVAHIFDQPRPGGGGYLNNFDADEDPDNPLPVAPTPEVVVWGFDKQHELCPQDNIVFGCCETFAAPTTIPFDSCFAFDTAVTQTFTYQDTSPFVIPAGPAGLTLTPVLSTTVAFAGTVDDVIMNVIGPLGAVPPGYELVILVNAVEAASLSFVAGANSKGFVFSSVGVAVVATDVVTAAIRPAVGGTITTVPVANLLDGETFTIDDGVNAATVFEFDVTGDGVGGGNVPVDVSVLITADEVRDAMIVAINGVGGTLDITAHNSGSAFVGLVHDNGSTGVAAALSETVTDGGFIVAGMSAGPFSPSWVSTDVDLIQPAAVVWKFDDPLPAGTYCLDHVVAP
jgi:hypothetical protein